MTSERILCVIAIPMNLILKLVNFLMLLDALEKLENDLKITLQVHMLVYEYT